MCRTKKEGVMKPRQIIRILRSPELDVFTRVKLFFMLRNHRNEPIMVFMFGFPGSGKSTIAKKLESFFLDVFGKDMEPLDTDLYLPDRYDKKNPSKYLPQVLEELEKKFLETTSKRQWAIFQNAGASLCPRGEKMLSAIDSGYYIFSILVDTSPEVAHERNNKRDRTIEPEMFEFCVRKVPGSFRILGKLGAGSMKIKNN